LVRKRGAGVEKKERKGGWARRSTRHRNTRGRKDGRKRSARVIKALLQDIIARHYCASHDCNIIEAPWLVHCGHGASLRHRDHRWVEQELRHGEALVVQRQHLLRPAQLLVGLRRPRVRPAPGGRFHSVISCQEHAAHRQIPVQTAAQFHATLFHAKNTQHIGKSQSERPHKMWTRPLTTRAPPRRAAAPSPAASPGPARSPGCWRDNPAAPGWWCRRGWWHVRGVEPHSSLARTAKEGPY
jgi:hypothetical protein